MREQLQERVAALRADFDRGNERIRQLDEEADKLRETLLRLAGAIQVLSEELDRQDAAGDSDGEGVGSP